jgi:hypothetical protein|tara:strand:- start:60 stop:263 length:204 start_codon:yes stop_codon:yes gene_type:complete
MKRNSVLKKFDKEIEDLYDKLYKIKELLEDTGDYELSELGNSFLDQIAEGLEDGDVSIENIRDQISG